MCVAHLLTHIANPTIEKVSEVWKDSLTASDFTIFNRRGYLSYSLGERLLVITLNTIPHAPKHAPVTTDVKGPFDPFAWLDATLLSLQKQGKFAYITGHIPPIVDSFVKESQWQVSYIETYKSIVSQFADAIKAQFFGHVQSIEVHVPPAKSSNASSSTSVHLVPLFLSGSISPYFKSNLSFTVWDYDAETYDTLDFAVSGTKISEEGRLKRNRNASNVDDKRDQFFDSLSPTAA
ncbi:hypothetical protein FI667_g16571, partial [Globisporangium splendens]